MKRLLLVLSAVALILAAAGCTGSSGSGGSDRSGKDDKAGKSETSEGSGDKDEAPEVVWQQLADVGFTPRHPAAGVVPAVTIYDDGRILIEAVDPEATYGHPAAFEVGTIPADDLEAFLSKAEGTGLFAAETEFGTPDVPDLPTTSVTLRTAGKARTVEVVGIGFDETTGGTEKSGFGITEAQSDKRAELRKLLGQADGLGGKRKQYVPERVRATIVPSPEGEGGDGQAEDWPGPAFEKFPAEDALGESCLVIEGAQAEKVYDAARENDTIRWTEGDQSRSIVIAPLLPGQEGCPPAE